MEAIPTQATGKYHVGFHEVPLMTSWLFLANLTIIVGAIKWHKYSFYIHTALGLVIFALTLAGTLHVLFDVGIGYNPTKRFQILHNTVGLVVVVWLSFQFITGVFSRLIQYSPSIHPTIVKWVKRVHYVSSYVLMALAKFEYLIIYYRRSKFVEIFGFLMFDCVCVAIYCWLKFRYPVLPETIIESQLTLQKEDAVGLVPQNSFTSKSRQFLVILKQKLLKRDFKLPQRKYLPVIYQSERQIPVSDYFLFNDYVYELDPIRQIHPGGQKIISLINQRQVDRFLYGFYPIEIPSGIVMHKHSEDSLKICGEPIARIQRNSPVKSMPDFIKVKMVNCKKVHQKSYLYIVHLNPAVSESQNWIQFRYEGLTHQKQLGQHFSLTLCDENNNKTTRLYTSVWCLRPQNIEFMEKYYPGSTTNGHPQFGERETQIETEARFEKEEIIPLMIKKYDDGEMSAKFLGTEFQGEMILSKPMGAGLKYDALPTSGKVIIICGGTGILPFLDLVDVLYKRVRLMEKTNLSSILLKNDPLIQQDIIKTREFVLYFACERIEDVHPLALHQINVLSHSKFIQFKSFVRVKNQSQQSLHKHYHNIVFQTRKFNDQLNDHLENKYGIAKIYICGPSIMNADASKILTDKKVSSDLYHFV